MTIRTKACLALIANSIVWGVSAPIIKYSLDYVTPIEFLTLRFFLVSLIVLPIFIANYKKEPFKTKDLPLLTLTALCGTSLTLGLLFWGLTMSSSLDSSVISAACPIMIVLAGVIFLKEVVGKQEKVGLFLAFLGTLAAVVSPLMSDGKTMFSKQSLLGNLLSLISNITWTIYALLSRKFSHKYSTFNITAFSFFIGFLTFLPLFLITKSTPILSLAWFTTKLPGLLGICYMVLFGSIIGYFTYTYGFSIINTSKAAIFTYLQPFFTVPLAVLWLQEKVYPSFLIGAGLIALGVILTEWKLKRRNI